MKSLQCSFEVKPVKNTVYLWNGPALLTTWSVISDQAMGYHIHAFIQSLRDFWLVDFFKTSNDIYLFPKHSQPPCTETHLSLHVEVLLAQSKIPLLKEVYVIISCTYWAAIFSGERWHIVIMLTSSFICVSTYVPIINPLSNWYVPKKWFIFKYCDMKIAYGLLTCKESVI